MIARPTSLRGRLRAIPAREARLQTELIGALNRREVDAFRTTARLANARDRRAATAWIDFETARGPVSVAPLLVDGTLARMTDGGPQPDGATAAATLGRIEPLVAALETGLGVALQPAGLSVGVEDDTRLMLRLDASTAQGASPHHRLIVAVPPDMDVTPLPLPTHPPAILSALHPRWTASLPGPRIAPARLATLGRGDMVLLGIGPLFAKISLPGRNDIPSARVEWGDRRLVVGDHGETGVSVATQSETLPDWQAMALPTVIEFEGAGLTGADLATLGQGSVLPLPSAGGTVMVRVRTGDTVIADGELVAVGDGFGILVTDVRQAQG